MNLSTGCPYCENLECKDEDKMLLANFACKANPERVIENAGACFVEVTDSGVNIIHDCPDFSAAGQNR